MTRDPAHITHLVIHCAATPNGRHFTAEDIDRWHKERGFRRDPADVGHHEPRLRHIGYHYVIYTNGAVRCGRSEAEVGAHCQGMNTVSIGVCLIGTDRFTRHQWESLRAHVQAIRTRYPAIQICGHRRFSKKLCPGFDVTAWLKGEMAPLADHLCEPLLEK